MSKPRIAITPFVISIDIAEQAPYTFTNIPPMSRHKADTLVMPVHRMNLPDGDYGIYGMIGHCAVERKSMDDMYNTIALCVKQRSEAGKGGVNNETTRFERELASLNEMPNAAVVIEAGLQDVMNPRLRYPSFRSKLNPRSAFGMITEWQVRFPCVQFVFAGSRRLAEIWTFYYLERVWRDCMCRDDKGVRT